MSESVPTHFVSTPPPRGEGIIGWFARNHVAANILMVLIIGAGIYTLSTSIKKETMPEFDRGQIIVSVPWRGGTPEEVETGILLRIESAIKGVEGIGDVLSTANEGSGRVVLDVAPGYPVDLVLDEVELAVNAISGFPRDVDRPIIQRRQPFTTNVMNVQVSGDLDTVLLQEIATDIRNEILLLPEVSQADLDGAVATEISIEISEATMQRYGLTLGQVAQAIQQWSVDVPSGGIRTEGGYVRVRATGQAISVEDYESIAVVTGADGRVVSLGDIATIIDGYSEIAFYSYFNGQPSIGISIDAAEREDSLVVAKAVREYVEQRKSTLPSSIELDYFGDATYYLNERLNMMLKNIVLGSLLVFVLLGIFLHARIAAWVCVGLPVAFLGALACLPAMDVSLNLISLFGFILVIGVVVDDAIIIAESAAAETELKGYNTENIVSGARRVAVPATFGVLTTVAAFAPMLMIQGDVTVIFQSIGLVVILCLLFSLVESKLILPSHMALMKRSRGKRRDIADFTNRGLKYFSRKFYLPFLTWLIMYRYACVSAFIVMLMLTVGLYLSPFLKKSFFPSLENDFVFVTANIMEGMAEDYIVDVTELIMTAMHDTNEEIMAETNAAEVPIKHVFAWITGDRSTFMTAELAKPEQRTLRPTEIANRWRNQVGNVAGATDMSFSAEQRFFGGAPIEFELSGKNHAMLEAAAESLADKLNDYDGVYEVRTPISAGPDEIKLQLKPEGIAAGLTLGALGRQVREAFFGVEAQRIQRGETEYRVIVRYPKSERESIGNLENMSIRLPDNTATPFYAVADFEVAPGYGTITRVNGERTLTVTAEVDPATVDPFVVFEDVRDNFYPQLNALYPSVTIEAGGSVRDQMSALEGLGLALLIALLSIYVLIAIPLKSYLQPLIIMSVIPFGLIGAVLGHAILGVDFNIVSMIGCIALTGVVVNDSLILVHYYNRLRREEGTSVLAAVLSAGQARLRAIILTSLTTFFGLVPILLETSLQAKMVANMAISLAFGILFATAITLILVPCLLRIGGDFTRAKDPDLLPTEPKDSSSKLLQGSPASA